MTRRPLAPWLLVALLVIVFAAPALASGGGPQMPWDTALSAIQDNLSGTAGKSLIIISAALGGIWWAFTDHGTGGRRISQVIIGGSVIVGGATFFASLGIVGALV